MTVYFVTEKGNSNGPVKIGVTIELEKRLSSLQTGHHQELEVIATVEGGRETETYFHEMLEQHRIRGEWFARTPEVDAAIAMAMRSGASALPIGDPGLPDRKFTISQDVELAQKISRYILGRLYPGDPHKFALPGMARRLKRYCPSMEERRLKALVHGEARRIDHFEMRGLMALRDEVDRIERARANLAAIPVIAAHLSAHGAPFDDKQEKAVDIFLQRCSDTIDAVDGDAR